MIKTNLTVDAKGLACPMPIVRTKKAMNELAAGQVLEVLATDKGSKADLQAWAQSGGHYYLGLVEEGDVLKHYIRKANSEDREEKKHPVVINNDELVSKLASDEDLLILDVREEAEFAFDHIPGAKSIPLGELDERISELVADQVIYVVCRTGSRSDLAAQKLSAKGFSNVVNVVPGMSEWSEKTEATI